MPVIQVNLLTGYSATVKRRLTQALTNSLAGVIEAAPDAVTVWLHEVYPDGYARGGVTRAPGPAVEKDQATLVKDYLSAMEARDLDDAKTLLSEDFSMTFPGGHTMTNLDQLIAWARERYHHVRKDIQSVTTAYEADHAVVLVAGTLSGTWLDGTGFELVRFIDRFEVRRGKLTRQDVWNDLANAHP